MKYFKLIHTPDFSLEINKNTATNNYDLDLINRFSKDTKEYELITLHKNLSGEDLTNLLNFFKGDNHASVQFINDGTVSEFTKYAYSVNIVHLRKFAGSLNFKTDFILADINKTIYAVLELVDPVHVSKMKSNSKEQLTYNQLSAYLPYTLDKLKMRTTGGKTVQLDGFKNALIANTIQGCVGGEYPIELLKPILRPLSDLYDNDGEHLTVNKLINLINDDRFGYYGVWINPTTNKINISVDIDEDNIREHIPFEMFEKVREELLRDKFDIFGLIEKGLAEAADDKTYIYAYGTKNSKPLVL